MTGGVARKHFQKATAPKRLLGFSRLTAFHSTAHSYFFKSHSSTKHTLNYIENIYSSMGSHISDTDDTYFVCGLVVSSSYEPY